MIWRSTCLGIILLLIVFSVKAQDQEPINDPVDTTWYVRGDLNYNLLIASYLGRDDDVLRFLDQGAFINSSTMSGNSPLLMAAGQGNLSTVRILLLNGAETTMDNIDGIFPLLQAALNNHTEVAELLINKGAEVNQTDNLGRTALLVASAYNYAEMADMLIYYGADVNLPDKQGTTPIMAAVYAGNIGLAQLLIDKGSDPNQPDKRGFTPLMVATQMHDTTFVNFLLEYQANMYAKNNAGATPFLLAVAVEDTLLTHDFLRRDTAGGLRKDLPINPMELARKKNNRDMLRLLQSYGYSRKFSLYPATLQAAVYSMVQPRDLFTGVAAGMTEGYTGISLTAGFLFRPAKIRVHLQEREHFYYQYWETRYILYAGLSRDLVVMGKYKAIQGGITLSLRGGYSFGKIFEGTERRPDAVWLLSPGAGIFYRQHFWQVNLSYHYQDLQTLRIYPHYISLGVTLRYTLRSLSLPTKTISWY